MNLWPLFAPAIILALVVALVWLRERRQRQPKDLGPSFRPWQVRLKPRSRK